jgi:SAM-dependent methyltransferase
MNNFSIKNEFYKNKSSWINSSKIGFSVDKNMSPLPWYCYQAIDYLEKNISKYTNIFEFGCGSSTLFFYEKVKKIIAIETNKFWFDYISNIISQKNKNYLKKDNFFKNDKIEIYLIQNALNDPSYENFAKKYSDDNNIKFNLIIIDSIKRFLCAINSFDAISDDGVIILDDSQRDNYKKIFEFMQNNNMQNLNFSGISPGQITPKNTSFFIKKL